MANAQLRGLNKEKFVCLLCLVLLVISGLFFFISRPTVLEEQEPVTDKKPPVNYELQARGPNTPISLEVDQESKSPFSPVRGYKVANTPKPPTGNKPTPPPLPPPQPAPTPKQSKTAYTPTEKDLEITFRGIVSKPGEPAYALVEKKDGTGYYRRMEGDTIEGLNYTITKIEPQAIHVTDADGRVYILKDGRFQDTSTSPTNSGSKLPKGTSGFGDPKPPAPKTPTKGKTRGS